MAALLANKTAAITGGVTGIGRAIALEYLRHGAAVTVNFLDDARSVDHFDSLKQEAGSIQGAKLHGVPGNIQHRSTAQEIVSKTVKEFGGLDVFVANAGVSQFRDFLTLDDHTLESHIQTNITGTFYTTRAAAEQMISQRRGGSILATSSISAHLGGAQQVHYTPTKAAILSMMQSQACALGQYQIRCNALLPGTTRTQLAAEDLAKEEKVRYLEQRTPLGRVGEPEDMAFAAVWLASDLSRFVTGTGVVVDGGLSISLQ